MPVRLKDIARDLGVSEVTVSKVLRGNADIGQETRNRVLKRMKELDYRPNRMAQGLASGKSYTVGMVVPDLVQPFFAEFAKALNSVLRKSNRALILTSSEEDPEMELQEIRALLARGVDVLLIASCQQNSKNFYPLGDQRTPFILIDRNFPHLAANFVGIDDYQAGVLATEHLIATGKRQIAHIGSQYLHPASERMRGYQTTMQKHGLSVPETFVLTRARLEEHGSEFGYEAMRKLMRRKGRPDGVFCYNDLSAIGATHAAAEAGLQIPEDVAFIGCGNVPYSNYLRCPLSSIDQSIAELGAAAGSLALELDKEPQPPRTIMLAPKLVVRESTVRS